MTRRPVPFDIGPVHFIGIGGIGMSGIAEILHNLGYKVQGSDQADGANVKRLRDLGVPIIIGHDAANLGDARVVVVSSAVKRDNPELRAARERLIRNLEIPGSLALRVPRNDRKSPCHSVPKQGIQYAQ